MQVKKSDAVKVLVAVGLKNTGTLNEEKLQEKLESLPKASDAQIKKMDKDTSNLYKALRAAIKDEKDITVEADKVSKKAKAAKKESDEDDDDEDDDEEEETTETEEDSDDEEEGDEGDDEEDDESEEGDEEESEDDDDEDSEEGDEDDETEEEDEPVSKKDKKNKKKDDKGKKGKGDKKEKKPRKDAAPKDRFGMREGTRAARLNKAITAKLKSIAQIQKDAKYEKAIHGHMNKLIAEGYVEKKKMKDGTWGYKETGKKYKAE